MKTNSTIFISLLLTIMGVFCYAVAVSQCNANDWQSLKNIFTENGGTSWQQKENWENTFQLDPSDPNCELEILYGVNLNDDGRVMDLLLPDNNLTGELSNSIADLDSLKVLMLNGNNLEGKVMSKIVDLKKLEVIRLFENNFTDIISDEIGQLAAIEELDLGTNQFYGKISNAVCELSNLNHFLVDGNYISGKMPSKLDNLRNLANCWVHNNQLRDSIPKGFAKMDGLELKVASNFFTFKVVEDHFETVEDQTSIENDMYSPQYHGSSQIQTVAKDRSITLNLSEPLPHKTTFHTNSLKYQWFKGDSLIGTDSLYTIQNAKVSDIGIYTVRITDEGYVSGLEVISMPIDLRLEGYDANGNEVVPRELIVQGPLSEELESFRVKSCGCNGSELHLLRFESESESNEKLANIDANEVTVATDSELDGGIKNNIFGREIILGDLPVYKYTYSVPDSLTFNYNMDTVRIYILDTGLNYTNDSKHYEPYLTSTKSCYGYTTYGHNFVSDNTFNNFADDIGHGTFGFRSIVNGIDKYFNLEVIPLRVFDETGRGTLFDFVCALKHSIDNGGDIVNFSGGLKGVDHPIIEEVIEQAKSQNTTIVCAAGNHSLNIDSVYYAPAHYSRKYNHVISVASIDTTNQLSIFSGYGNSVTLAAYGEHAEGYSLRQDCVSAGGTSISTFFVARALAIELLKNKNRTCDTLVKDFLNSDALIYSDTLKEVTYTGKYLNMSYKKLSDEDACCQSPQVNFRIDTTCHTATLTWDDNFLRLYSKIGLNQGWFSTFAKPPGLLRHSL